MNSNQGCACGGEGSCQCGQEFDGNVSEVVCDLHGAIPRVVLTIPTNDAYDEIDYPFCQYCYGEWAVATFPVSDDVVEENT